MPVHDVACLSESCRLNGTRFERYFSTNDKPNPLCEACGEPTRRMISRFSCPWTGTLDRFNDPNKERFNQHPDGGHVAYRVRSSRLATGAPEPVVIRTRQDQREFCQAEGLHMPDDIGQHVEAGADGMSMSSQGMPGSWV